MTWHLIAKYKGEVVWDIVKFTLIGEAWDFVNSMKNELLIDEIIWSIRDKKDKEIDKPIHLKRKNNTWIRDDILNWKKD